MKLSKSEFLILQQEWYDKLKEQGFKDIERKNQDDWLKDEVHTSTLKNAHINRISREKYFEKACEFLHRFDFDSELDKLIWEQHCDGKSIREIAKELLKEEGKRGIVFIRIKKLKSIAKL